MNQNDKNGLSINFNASFPGLLCHFELSGALYLSCWGNPFHWQGWTVIATKLKLTSHHPLGWHLRVAAGTKCDTENHTRRTWSVCRGRLYLHTRGNCTLCISWRERPCIGCTWAFWYLEQFKFHTIIATPQQNYFMK